MKLDVLSLGEYRTNCYIVRAEGASGCAVIDPGCQPERILNRLQAEGLTLEAVLLTHGHFDHTGAARKLAEATGCRVWIHRADYEMDNNPTNAFFYPLSVGGLPQIAFCHEETKIAAGGLTFTVLETPGHTGGSVCYLQGDAMFCGDTLFEGSCGRTDLPGGSWKVLNSSMEKLRNLPGDYCVYPGHGPATTLLKEKRFNPYLKGIV